MDEVFQLMFKNKQIYVEIKQCERYDQYGKYPGIVTKVIQLIEKYNLEQQAIIISFDWYILLESKEKNKNIKTGALLDENLMVSEFNTFNCWDNRCVERLKKVEIDYLIIDYLLMIKQENFNNFIIDNNWSAGCWCAKGTLLDNYPETIKIIMYDNW